MDLLSQIREGGILYILLVIAIAMHEFGHAFVADKLGDRLPRLDGRVTLNPVAHMDMMGTVVFPLVTIALSIGSSFPMVFGWGKPVRIGLDNPKTRKRTEILCGMAGVSMNLVVALISAIVLAILIYLGLNDYAEVAAKSIMINSVLFVINLIPVPPLDGSIFLKYAVNMSEQTYYTISRWGILILLLIINVPLTANIVYFAINSIYRFFLTITNIILSIGG